MTDYNSYSRTRRHKKRKSSKRKFLFFASLAILFCIILFSLIVFGNKENPDKEQAFQDDSEAESAVGSEADNTDPQIRETIEIEDDSDEVDEEEQMSDVNIKEVESDDENVIQAYTGDWQPVGTSQSGPHTTNYEDGSLDRIEIKRAVSIVTGISENDMIEYWVGNGGEQKVEATVSDKAQANYFRVYLSWVDEEGWQVTRAERLKGYEKQKKAKEEGSEEE